MKEKENDTIEDNDKNEFSNRNVMNDDCSKKKVYGKTKHKTRYEKKSI